MVPLTDDRGAAPARWRWREREWSRIALAVVATTLVFALWPELDLLVSRQFVGGDGRFVGNHSAAVRMVYEAVPWFGRELTLAALLLAVLPRSVLPGLGRRWRRRAAVTAAVMVLGVGLVVNGGLKEFWGRARPVAVTPFGGTMQFESPLRPATQCRHNCSFVSGHAATGFALLAFGVLGAPATRRRWLLAAAISGGLIGLGRVAQGGHFVSDVIGAGLVMWFVGAAVRHGVLWHTLTRRRSRRRVVEQAEGCALDR